MWITAMKSSVGSRFNPPIQGDNQFYSPSQQLEVKVWLNTAGDNGVVAGEGAVSNANNSGYIYCVNNFGHTLWSQLNVSFNGVLMTGRSNAYHQKAYIETLLNYTPDEGKTLLATQGWVNVLNVRSSLTPTNAQNNDEPDPND